LCLSFLVRFEFMLSDKYYNMFIDALPLFVIIKLIMFSFFKMYQITWRYVSLHDLWNIIKAVVASEIILMFFIYVVIPDFAPHPNLIGFPRSIFIIDAILAIFLIGGVRIAKRTFNEVLLNRNVRKGLSTLIVGAGNIGEMILRDIVRQNFSEFYPIGFVDDDPRKIGSFIHNVKVLGPISDLAEYIKKYKIEAIIIAISSLNYKNLQQIYNTAKTSGVKTIKIIPRIYAQDQPQISLRSLEDISIEDLIGRQIVEINYNEIKKFIQNKSVLITGAGGSIGSEIALQINMFNPKRLILVDIDETELHNLQIKLGSENKGQISFVVADIKDEKRINAIFSFYKPEIVFHSAAYKHVPMMEYNPEEAVKVNIFGTYIVAKASVNIGVRKFINISTDKAVNPTSVMGATKRMAEYICKAFNDIGSTEFISVRFGNVLGSRGSVLPLFFEQIKKGGPLTVTHPEMRRYFMTIPEAVSLVLEASAVGKGGEIYVLDMGEPVKILTLAEEFIKMQGLTPYKDIDIVFTGIRPGEKLFEEILTAEEGTTCTRYERIFIAKDTLKYSLEEIEKALSEFRNILENQLNNGEDVKILLKKYIKSYQYEKRASS